jgi:hypothetical protein
MATFNNSGAYSILSTQKGTYYVQGGHYFTPGAFVDLGTTLPTQYQSLSSERSDIVNIVGGAIDGVTIGPNSTINAPIGGGAINGTPIGATTPSSGAFTTLSASGQATLNTLASSGAVVTGGSINNTPIGQNTPVAGAFTTLNSTSANILGPLIAEGVSSSANAQAPSPTNSGITWGSSPTWAMQSFYDQSNTVNNRSADLLFITGSIKFRFANDARNAFLDVFSITGGQASGVTGITSSSGSGSWVHTGAFSASGSINTSVGLTVKEGANAKQGVATLVAGTVTVSNTSVTATSRIQLTVQSLGTVTAPKAVAVTARTAGTSFTITSADNTDTSVVAYEIFEVGS